MPPPCLVARVVKEADRQGINFRLDRLDAQNGGLHEFDRRELAFAQLAYSFGRGQAPQISHYGCRQKYLPFLTHSRTRVERRIARPPGN